MDIFSQYALGIEITADSATLVALQSSAKGCKLVGHDVFALEPGVETSDKIKHLGALINSFVAEHKLLDSNISISVPANLAVIRDISFPLSVKENLRETMVYEVEKFIPFSREEIYFDCQVTGEDKAANTVEVLLVVARKKDMDPYIGLQNEIGAVYSLEIAATALAFGLNKEVGVNWGTGGGGVLINPEGNRFRCSVVNGQSLLASQVVHQGKEKGGAFSLLSDTILSLQKKHVKRKLSETVYYCSKGEGGIDSVSLEKMKILSVPVPDLVPAANLTTAYCLALKGLRQPSRLINLLPEKLRKRQKRTAMYMTLALAALVALLAVSLGGTLFFQQKMINSRLADQESRLLLEVEQLPNIQDKIVLLQKRNAYLSTLDGQATAVLDTITELSVLLPESSWVQRLSYSKRSVRIDGYADSASELIAVLESSSLFANVSFVTAVRKGKDNKEQFAIEFSLSERW